MPMRLQGVLHRSLLLSLLLLAGCTTTSPGDFLPADLTVEKTCTVTPASPLAWHPTGERVALVRKGLAVWTPATDELTPVRNEIPTALAWSPAGETLAAAYAAADFSRLQLLAGDGRLRQEAVVPGQVASLAWRDGELLCLAAVLRNYKFGGNFTLILYRWSGGGEPAATPLYDTTLMPHTVRQWGPVLPQTAAFALAPLGDAILFARLRDPPAFSPYLELVLHHLDSGGERRIADVPMGSDLPPFAADGESVLFAHGGTIQHLQPWQQEETATLAAPLPPLSVSPGGRYLLVAGELFRDGQPIAAFPPTSTGWFAPGGGRLLLRRGNELFLLGGLADNTRTILAPDAREHLLLLRRWRSLGLITPDEFQGQTSRIAAP